VIGAGRLGGWLAFLSARAGYRTILEDVMPSNLRRAEERLLELNPSRNIVEFASSVEGAVREADLIIDCVPDELESKLEIFSLLDRMAPPHAILATPTLALSIADLALCTYRAAQCVAFALNAASLQNEAQFPKTVTVVHTPQTLPEVLSAVVEFWKALCVETTLKVDEAIDSRGERNEECRERFQGTATFRSS